MLVLKEELRKVLKRPIGQLFPNFEDALQLIKKTKFLISVGDETTINLLKNNLTPNLAIIDNHIQKKRHNIDLDYTKNVFNVNNPPGTITDQLWETIDLTIKKSVKHQLIIVDGEEDLAVLPCCLMAPEYGIILYGQPNQGLVLVKASDVKEKAEKYIEMFDVKKLKELRYHGDRYNPKKENKVLNRNEVRFDCTYTGETTPKILDVKNKLVALLNTKKELLVIDSLQPNYGEAKATGYAKVYDSKEDLEGIEPKNIVEKNKEPEIHSKETTEENSEE